ncbi:MAG: hypothetical protein L0Y60_04650 [Beijerinckiaceae bacterium]|nr:hypothetical protein [Beijerinckiaceae bacterium]
MSFFRAIFWFEKGELREIASKLAQRKMGYEASWEVDVLLPLAAVVPLAFVENIWLGLLSVWAFKQAIRALNKKRFFDPLP